MSNQHQTSSLERHVLLMPLYIKIAFGSLILFGIVGNFIGRYESGVAILIITSNVWASVRIMREALDAYQLLSMIKKYHENQSNKQKDEKKT